MVSSKKAELHIYHEGLHVGDISYNFEIQKFGLLYSSDWLRSGFALSPHLPLFDQINSENLSKFLENLLPEEDALKTLARTLQLTSGNTFGLLAAIGKDATGAFSFLVEEGKIKTSFRAISIEELISRVLKRADTPISVWDNKPRLSLAGVQEKLGVTLKDGEYGFGEGDLASTHILKFSKKDQHLVLNEFFCMTLAKKIGLSVANVELVHLGERVLRVERFDRKWKSRGRVSRLHVIDGCQALNIPPTFKYQRVVPDGPNRNDYLSPVNIKNLSLFCQKCRVPAKARLQFLQWVLFNLLIGNTDSHGKNISYFVSNKGYELAPAYDLLNVTVYEGFNHELAFKIGETFVLDEVKAYQLFEMSQEMELAPRLVANQLKKICNEILKQADLIVFNDLDSAEKLFIEKLAANIKERVNVFLTQVPLIMSLAKAESKKKI